MPLALAQNAPTMLVRRSAFEHAGLTRSAIDERFGLTEDEFRVEGDLIAIGPLHADDAAGELTDELEALGLVYYDDFFDVSGNWPEWLRLYAMTAKG